MRIHAIILAILGAVASVAVAAELPDLRTINKGIHFPEGPVFQGSLLYYVGYGGSGVLSWDGARNTELFNEPKCGPTAVHPVGDNLLVACNVGNELVLIRPDGHVLRRVARDRAGKQIVAPNDFATDGRGGLYVTGSGSSDTSRIDGKVYHVDKDLAVAEVASDIHFANGIALSPDGKRLLVAEPEAQRIISFATDRHGKFNERLTDRQLFVRVDKFDPEGGIDAYPDGIKFGPDGNLWVGEYSKGRVVVFSADGKRFLKGIDFPGEQACTNIAFSPDGRSAAATCVNDTVNEPWPGTIYMWSISP